MGDYTYLVPANSKKQNLIMGFMTMTDLIIILVSLTMTIALLFILSATKLLNIIIILLPLFIGGLLIFPVENRHNVRVFLSEIYKFYFKNRRKYVWRGWCYSYEQSDE